MLRIFDQENKKGPQPANSFPVSLDVKSLYSNIPADGEEGGMRAFQEMLENRADQTIATSFLMSLLAFVLKGNTHEKAKKKGGRLSTDSEATLSKNIAKHS